MTRDRYHGTFLGLALGDARGAPHEGGPLERFLWRLLGTTRDGRRRWSDDTQMSLDVAESLVATGGVDQDDLARRFAASYRWRRGYGPGAAKLLRRIARGEDWRIANRAIYRDGSHGNGGAMRAPILALYYPTDRVTLIDAARRSAMVTHAHPLGIAGAVIIASATAAALNDATPRELLEHAGAHCSEPELTARLTQAATWLGEADAPAPSEVAKHLGNGVAATRSCATAVYLAGRFLARPFPELVEFVIAMGGDVDTIAAMAGAIWGAARGAAALPAEELRSLEQHERIADVATALFAARGHGSKAQA